MTAATGAAGGELNGRDLALTVIGWLVERHHQSLGLWPWTWTGPAGEPYVTLYAGCAALRFGRDFGALANWVEANRWPTADGLSHPQTLYRDRLAAPDWAMRAPAGTPPLVSERLAAVELEQLARGGAPVETLAQLLESTSGLDQYLAMLAPQRHGGHPHRDGPGRTAVVMMRLATRLALALGTEYAIPWTGPAGGRANGISDPDWPAFLERYGLADLPCPPAAQEIFTFGDHGWLHADGWLGDRHGNVVRLGVSAQTPSGFSVAWDLAARLFATS